MYKTRKAFMLFLSMVLVVSLSPFLEFFSLNAASLSPISDTLSSSGIGTNGPEAISATGVNHKITYTAPTALGTGSTINVYFQTGSTVGGGQTNTGFSAVAVSSGATVTAAGTTVATNTNFVVTTGVSDPNFSGYTFTEVVITTTAAIASGNAIVINGITATNPPDASTSTNQYVIDVTDSASDDGYLAVPILSNSTVAVTARVTPEITFALSSNATNFGVLQIGSVNTSSPATTLTLSTNARSGASVTVYDQGNGTNPGLYNSLATHTIPSATATLAAGTEGYGVNSAVTSTAGSGGVVGTLTVASPYNGTGDSVGGLNLAPTLLASTTSPIYLVTLQVNYLSAISVVTPAGIYTDNVTYLASGNF